MNAITLIDKNQEKINPSKIIDRNFDKKLEEFLSVERNIKSVKVLFQNFFNQTNSKNFLLSIFIFL
jgi:hypothetical protein